MLSTQYLTENYCPQTFTFAAARLVLRMGCSVAKDVRTIRKHTPIVLSALRTGAVCTGYALGIVAMQLVMWTIALVRFLVPLAVAGAYAVWANRSTICSVACVAAKTLVLVGIVAGTFLAVVAFWAIVQQVLVAAGLIAIFAKVTMPQAVR